MSKGGAAAAFWGAALLVASGGQAGAQHLMRCAPGIGHPALRDQVCVSAGESYGPSLCAAMRSYARQAGLPPGFFARLIWKESRFNPNAVSPKGAEGVAQFMPGTARRFGLDDPADPAAALRASARYLSLLEREFGSLGLAAAGYNAGENRIRAVVAGERGAPFETQDYVLAITGASIQQWIEAPPETRAVVSQMRLDPALGFDAACERLAQRRRIQELGGGARHPWGVRVAGGRSPSVARRVFARLKARHAAALAGEDAFVTRLRPRLRGRRLYGAYIGRATRSEALALCRKLRQAGLTCVVART